MTIQTNNTGIDYGAGGNPQPESGRVRILGEYPIADDLPDHVRQPRQYAEHDTADLAKSEGEAKRAGWVLAAMCAASVFVSAISLGAFS